MTMEAAIAAYGPFRDSGEVPVGEVTTYSLDEWAAIKAGIVGSPTVWTLTAHIFAKPSDPNAKPSMPALSRIAGEAYRGLGWCDE
jgi:hypothetical protein